MAIRRKLEVAAPKKAPYDLVGGPLDGVRVWLSTPSTLPISMKGQRGVYRTDATVAGIALRWFPADHA